MKRPYGSFHRIGMIADTNIINIIDDTEISVTFVRNFNVNKDI